MLELDADIRTAMEKMKMMREIEGRLYGMDCGSCGAPSCKALAEDIVRGFATEEACIFKLREEIRRDGRGAAAAVERDAQGRGGGNRRKGMTGGTNMTVKQLAALAGSKFSRERVPSAGRSKASTAATCSAL